MSSHPVYGMLRAGLMIDNLKLSQKYYFDMSHGNVDMALADSLEYFNEELSIKEEGLFLKIILLIGIYLKKLKRNSISIFYTKK